MKRVLLTGGSGFIGRNIKTYLGQVCELFLPSRFELNLMDETEIISYIENNQIDIIIHSANPNPAKNELDHADRMFEDSMRMFMNIYQAAKHCEMVYFLGSGAEYDKSKEIVQISENEEGRAVPYDSYGLAKFVMDKVASSAENICNLRIFGCYGPTDHASKFIAHCIDCCKKNEDITIRQDCYFDYMLVYDLGRILEYFIYHKPRYKNYNVCTGTRFSLKEIAEEVHHQMGTDNRIVVLSEGMNREYTGSNERLTQEIGDFKFTTLKAGIAIQIESN